MTYKRTHLPYTGNWICRACGRGNIKELKACATCATVKS